MKYIIILLFCLNLFMPPVYSLSVDSMETLFKSDMPKGVVYTKVPRGLIVSVDEDLFFRDCESAIKESSLYILDTVAELLKKIPNYCVIENHLKEEPCEVNLHRWELSSMRSSNIAEYFVKCHKISPDKIFDIGFGESMPFNENVSPEALSMNNRVDFVMIEYETKR